MKESFPIKGRVGWPNGDLESEVGISFLTRKAFKTSTRVKTNTTDYRITWATMVFSNKSCENSKSTDYFDMKFTFDLDDNGEVTIYQRPIYSQKKYAPVLRFRKMAAV